MNKEQDLYDQMLKLSKTITCFNKITDGTNTIQSTSTNSTLKIECDDNIKVELNPDTNTLKISLSDEFKASLTYKSSSVQG